VSGSPDVNIMGGCLGGMTAAIVEAHLAQHGARIAAAYNAGAVGQVGRFGQANYAAVKSGQFGLTKALTLETAAKGSPSTTSPARSSRWPEGC
jgi:3-oxoacyl-[acyl-carrier protein] reductase